MTQLIWVQGLVEKFSSVTAHKTQRHGAPANPIQDSPTGTSSTDFRPVTAGAVSLAASKNAVKLAHAANFDASCSELCLTVKSFNAKPILQIGLGKFKVSGRLKEDVHVLDVEGTLHCNVMSDLKHVWEPIIEPLSLSCRLTSQQECARQDLEMSSDHSIQVSIAPDHISSLSETYAKFDKLIKSLAADPYAYRYLLQNTTGSPAKGTGMALSDFFGTFMPKKKVVLMNSTNLMLNVMIETADGMDNFEVRSRRAHV